jgi:subtilisin family serine protease
MKIKHILAIIVALLCMHTTSNAEVDLSSKPIVPLYKNSTTKVLAGVANIRLKKTAGKIYDMAILNAFSANNDGYKIIGHYLADEQCISNQTLRFSKYPTAQQQRILALEEELKRTFIVEFDTNISVLNYCKMLMEHNPDIEIAEPYYVMEACVSPNDPDIGKQTALKKIKTLEAFEICQGDSSVLLGIADSGFNIFHEDFYDGVAINENEIPDNLIDDDGNGYVDDYYGYNFSWLLDGGESQYGSLSNSEYTHGTYVGGMAGARVNNGKGIAGTAFDCKIVPIKILSTDGSNDYLYCYQSIIYAAVRGCKVLNCSWGAFNSYSLINQSIIDYAVACDVALVAAGGNLTSGHDAYATYYPASYNGVLGVGMVDNDDQINLALSVIGVGMRLMAPGIKNYSIANAGNGYVENTGSGSSFASPIVAGAVAVIRSYFPQLTPIQALEVARYTGDEIRGVGNNANNHFIPKRLNMQKALELQLDSTPIITLQSQYYETTTGIKTQRFVAGDTAIMVLKLVNVMANASDVRIELNKLYLLDSTAITLLDSVIVVPTFNHNDSVNANIRFIVNNPSNVRKIFYTANIYTSDTAYEDEFKLHISIHSDLTTFENEKLIVSARDNGILGYNRDHTDFGYGYGFEHKQLGDFLYEGGPMLSADYSKIVSANKTSQIGNAFKCVKSLSGTDSNVSIIADSMANANRIGVELTNKYIFPSDTSSILKMALSAKNTTNKVVNDFVIGYYFDWDINNYDCNEVGYFAEAVPDFLTAQYAAAEYMTDEHHSVYAGSLIYYNKYLQPSSYVIPQAAGLVYDDMKTNALQIQAITSGIKHQKNGAGEYQYAVGMHFTDPFEPQHTLECTICTGIAKTKEELAQILINCAAADTTSIYDVPEHPLTLTQNDDHLIISSDNNLIGANIIISDVLGCTRSSFNLTDETQSVSIAELQKGVYFVKFEKNGTIYLDKFFRY